MALPALLLSDVARAVIHDVTKSIIGIASRQ